MTTDDVRKMLRTACTKAGSMRAWAREHQLSPAYVSDVLRGRRDPGPAICDVFGIEPVNGETTYRKAK